MNTKAVQTLFLSALAGLMLASTVPGAVSAHEPYEQQVPWGGPIATPAPGAPTCADREWASPIVKIHTSEFTNALTGTGTVDDMVQAVEDVNAQIARVGGTSAYIEKTQRTTTGFHRDYAYGDTTPTIHVGYLPLTHPTIMGTTTPYSCERFIAVDTATYWNYLTPEDITNDYYYIAGRYDPKNYTYFRLSYQHELMHAFEIYVTPNDPVKDNHPDNVYSFLNYDQRPWVHTSKDSMIRPLPYDARKLREKFPASTSRTEVAVTNTWIDKSQTPADGSGTTPQEFLCAPSVGSSASGMFSDYCGDAGATSFCPGDTLQVRYTLANYSTESVGVVVNLWLSKDDVWDQDDTMSTTSQVFNLDAAHSEEWPAAFPLPAVGILGGKFYPIIRATATTPSGVTVKDSIPLRGTITQKVGCAMSHN